VGASGMTADPAAGGVLLNGASDFPDIYSSEGVAEKAVDVDEGDESAQGQAGAEAGPATAVLERGDEPHQAELFPRDREAEADVYVPPDAHVLKKSSGQEGESDAGRDRISRVLVETLASFGIEAAVIGTVSGPRVTRSSCSLRPASRCPR